MNILDDVLMEEIQKREINLDIKRQKLATLPKGALYFDRKKTTLYAYRKWRDGSKVYSEYLGIVGKRATTKKMDELAKARNELAQYKKEKKELEELKKAYRLILFKTKLN